jgi:hypothetical protein
MSLIWGMIMKFILPASLFNFLTYHEEKPMDDKEEKKSLVASLRLSQR